MRERASEREVIDGKRLGGGGSRGREGHRAGEKEREGGGEKKMLGRETEW